MNLKENVINFFRILALLRGPIFWSSRDRFGPRAANWRPLFYSMFDVTFCGNSAHQAIDMSVCSIYRGSVHLVLACGAKCMLEKKTGTNVWKLSILYWKENWTPVSVVF